jgi:hypothetical protein
MNGLLIPAYVTGINALKDKSVKITLMTQELSPGIVGELFRLHNSLVVAYISEKEPYTAEIDAVDKLDPEIGGKTQSQRIRNVLYKLYEQSPEGFSTFDNYYKSKTEKYIEMLKSKIEP